MTGTERGDLSDFDDFVVARGAALLRTAYLLTGDRHLAEDLVQAALAKTYRHWKRVRGGSPEAYVRQVMVRENISGGGAAGSPRRRWPRCRSCGFRHGSTLTVGCRLDAALRLLSAQQRAVLVLRYYEDLTERQAADALGCSVGTVKTQAHRALKRLREVAPSWLSCGPL